MAVTKMSVVSVLVVLAITYNQGAARPMSEERSNNELYSSEESGPLKTYMLPTAIEKGLVITINGTIDTNAKWFIVEFPSLSGKQSCRIEYNYIEQNMIYITPALDGYESAEYDLKDLFSPGSSEGPSFSLRIVARVDNHNNDMLDMTFLNEDVGPSSQLICQIQNFNDINQIVIKSGVDNVDTLLFEFE